ncbi:4Fe-4S binding protein [Agathobaculum sp. NSJ-28]|uniref:4Fe-4S binding protein n=2 Tax=Agathobaculum TaxID=2048137 RepID=A0A923RWH6_9FIRM|nr:MULTISPECIES: 4Fe-4S binding protein [Butyricicoccaceae]MBC5726102.1 4Fe-4S binding protein [Agathobaculum faecis]MBS6883679.1 4Fe-4S binding protein [Clostridiaceae bacterium]MCU6790260.1 4Fe-4S binding protein [Agathobaculum ammoniilyticum]WOC76865.1 4Fe-4S binding protein [Intestinibacillus sp. NTUH-41-i26]
MLVQLAFTALTNGYAAGFAKGSIYKGPGKFICLPGLNCYSCPGALGSCPIGSLQAVIGSRSYRFSFYIAGFLLLFGALFGRLVCGWLCPFGLVQDLLYKIPFVKKLRRLPGDRWLKYLKYVILAGFVIVLPLTVLDIVGQGQPWFCKYICPSGTLFAGIPLIASNPPLRAALGWLFTWKAAILAALLLLSLLVYRPFCRYLCPLGAIYGLFNPAALYRFRIDKEKCTGCGACQKACKLDIPIHQTPNSPECIRCGDCRRACPHGAICTANRRAARPFGKTRT